MLHLFMIWIVAAIVALVKDCTLEVERAAPPSESSKTPAA